MMDLMTNISCALPAARRRTAKMQVMCAVLCLVVGGVYADESRGESDTATPQRVRTGIDTSGYQGLLFPGHDITLHVPVEGILKTLNVKEGDTVKQGDVLLVMDDRVQAARVEVAQRRVAVDAELHGAQLAAEEARISWKMLERAYEQDAASDWEVRKAKLQHDQQLANVEVIKEQQLVAKAMLAHEQAGLAQYRLEAPFDGEVVKVIREEGEMIRREHPVLSLVSLSPLRAEIHIPMALYGELKVGQVYPLQAGDPIDKELAAELIFIDPRIDPASQTFRCVFNIPNEDGTLPSGVAVWLVTD